MDCKLLRITSEYVQQEDRMRLTGEDAGVIVVMWMSRRMLHVLLPHCFQWLTGHGSGDGYSDVVQGFAQHAAEAALPVQSPVQPTPDSTAWLIQKVDVTTSTQTLALRFRDGGDTAATLTLDPTQLRQWLGILHTQTIQAQWQLDVWPEWVGNAQSAPSAQAPVWH